MSSAFRVVEGSVSPCLHTPPLLEVSAGPWPKSRVLEPCGSRGTRGGEKRYRVPQLAHSPDPAAQACREGKKGRVPRRGWQELGVLGRRQGGSGVGLWGCWGRALRHAAFPPPPASVWRVPTSLRQESSLLGRHCPAAVSCLLCLFSVSLR